MGIIKLFSKREKEREQAGQQDVYQYDTLPKEFRVQVIHIWNTAIGPYYVKYGTYSSNTKRSPSNRLWESIHDPLAREKGVFHLGDSADDPEAQCMKYLLSAETRDALDIIELSFQVIDIMVRRMVPYQYQMRESKITQEPDNAIEELNYRFRDHGIGYQFSGGELIRVNSQYIHEEAVKPAISLLNDVGFEGVLEEFLNAHEHYRKGDSKDAIDDALHAFESTMKAICDAHGWSYSEKATAKPLLDIIFTKGLIPINMQSHMAGIRTTLESGLPTLRNKTEGAGHGQGKDKIEIPDYLAAYALHLAATNIVLLVEAHKSLQ